MALGAERSGVVHLYRALVSFVAVGAHGFERETVEESPCAYGSAGTSSHPVQTDKRDSSSALCCL